MFVAAFKGIVDFFDYSAAVGLAVDFNVLPQTHCRGLENEMMGSVRELENY